MDFAKGNSQECFKNPVQRWLHVVPNIYLWQLSNCYFGVLGIGKRIENGGEEVLIKVGMLIIVFSFAENTNRVKPISFGPKYNLTLVLLLFQLKTALTI